MAISGPVPPYANVPIQPQYYSPRRFQISDVQIGITTIVTATANLNYVIGQLVRLLIPKGYGCTQLNEMLGYVLSLPALNEVEVNINSTLFNSYIAANLPQVPQIIAVGDVNTGSTNAGLPEQTYISGSFINISPI